MPRDPGRYALQTAPGCSRSSHITHLERLTERLEFGGEGEPGVVETRRECRCLSPPQKSLLDMTGGFLDEP